VVCLVKLHNKKRRRRVLKWGADCLRDWKIKSANFVPKADFICFVLGALAPANEAKMLTPRGESGLESLMVS
jgi:hypothetical protein